MNALRLMSKGLFTIYVYRPRWMGGCGIVNKCKRGVGRWFVKCKCLHNDGHGNHYMSRKFDFCAVYLNHVCKFRKDGNYGIIGIMRTIC